MRSGIVIAAAAAVLTACAALPAGAESNAAELRAAGEWTGKYVCQQGVTGMRLVVQVDGENATATMHFFPLPENPRVAEGCFTMSGAYNPASGRLTLIGAKWIKQPRNYVMAGMLGIVDSEGRNLSGNVVGAPNCSIFVLTRDEATRPMPRACSAEVLR